MKCDELISDEIWRLEYEKKPFRYLNVILKRRTELRSLKIWILLKIINLGNFKDFYTILDITYWIVKQKMFCKKKNWRYKSLIRSTILQLEE